MVQETMSMPARYEYIRALRDVYLRADRKEKGTMLAHIQTATQMNRKYIITCLNDPDLQRHKRSRERGRYSFGTPRRQMLPPAKKSAPPAMASPQPMRPSTGSSASTSII